MKCFEFDSQQSIYLNNMIQKMQSQYFSKKNGKNICMCNNCNKGAINSHAISKEQSLRTISDNGAVMAFESKRRKDKINGKDIVLESIGINDASAFKGFCIEHDNLFAALDLCSVKSTVQDVLLQAYRSVCFSLFNTQFLEIQEVCSNEFLSNLFTPEKLREHLEFSKDQDGDISNDLLVEFFNSINKEHSQTFTLESRMLLELKNQIECYLTSDIAPISIPEEQKEFVFIDGGCDFCTLYCKIDLTIPVGVLNHHLLKIREKTTIFLFTVVPHNNGTEFFWIFDKTYYPIFEMKWRTMLQKDINIINSVESSMMHCENWYIKPTIVQAIPSWRLQIIEEDMYFNNERSPFDDYDLSLFDDLRIAAIKNESDRVKAEETKKIEFAVTRDSYLKRLERYNQDVYDSL